MTNHTVQSPAVEYATESSPAPGPEAEGGWPTSIASLIAGVSILLMRTAARVADRPYPWVGFHQGWTVAPPQSSGERSAIVSLKVQ
ncbi:MAG: hypothetical protein QOD35_1358 [Nocardioidaceae bacterium]|jgi:hypothetical protein|nr:hypothetical protein [Nocardioidaceae bacterium]